MGLIDTGNGATLAVTGFAGDGVSAKVVSIGSLEETVERIDVSHLTTAGHREYMMGDLIDHGEIEAEYYFGTASPPVPQTGAGVSGTSAVGSSTVTINFPGGTGSNGTLSGSGFISKRRGPELRNNAPQIAMIGVAFDGFSGPTYS